MNSTDKTKPARRKVGFLIGPALDPLHRGPLAHPLTVPASTDIATRKKVPLPSITTIKQFVKGPLAQPAPKKQKARMAITLRA